MASTLERKFPITHKSYLCNSFCAEKKTTLRNTALRCDLTSQRWLTGHSQLQLSESYRQKEILFLSFLHFCSFQELLPGFLRSFSFPHVSIVQCGFRGCPVIEAESCPAQVVQTLIDSFSKQVSMRMVPGPIPGTEEMAKDKVCSNTQVFKDIQRREGVCHTGLLRGAWWHHSSVRLSDGVAVLPGVVRGCVGLGVPGWTVKSSITWGWAVLGPCVVETVDQHHRAWVPG